MKCLSVCQPFAELIVQGKKTVELRKWNTKFRGEFLVHAAKNILLEDCNRMNLPPKSMITGAIIGKVSLVDVKKYNSEKELFADRKKHHAETDYIKNRYGFILEKPKQLKVPIPYNGQLNFFEFKPEVLTTDEIKTDLFDEEHRYMWINHH
ncbi:MAG: ASCH domain-containing protein [Candidatus Nitrosopelagicus sp.]|jgi:predicted transcriptional regulator|nr:ASCH domain-containing protein [Candidatus Nitrosopelagicus sp.]|tara:strand:- start:624 stop:1076 length:453 start_codon:yes stop_codon:yes gene_type:complete